MKLNGTASKMEQMGSETVPRLVGLCSVVWVRNLKSRFAPIWFRFSRIFWDFLFVAVPDGGRVNSRIPLR